MNWSPHLMLAIANARVKGKNPAEACARIFAKSTLELRSGKEGDWDGSTILGTSDLGFVLDTITSVRMGNQSEIRISQAGMFTWFCVKSKRYPAMYWSASADIIQGSHLSPPLVINTPMTLNTMQLSEIK